MGLLLIGRRTWRSNLVVRIGRVDHDSVVAAGHIVISSPANLEIL